jgi:hypothetical protein
MKWEGGWGDRWLLRLRAGDVQVHGMLMAISSEKGLISRCWSRGHIIKIPDCDTLIGRTSDKLVLLCFRSWTKNRCDLGAVKHCQDRVRGSGSSQREQSTFRCSCSDSTDQ